MKILSIKSGKKHLDHIILEDGTEICLDKDVVEAKKLCPGFDITEPEELVFESDYARAKSRALWYLSRSDHSEKALRDKLIAAGFGYDACEAAVNRMAELGLVDDERYARRLAEYLSAAGSSKKEIRYKLSMKGISSDIIKEIFCEDETDEREKIARLIETKFKTKLNSEKDVEKVFAALVRKGFSYSDIKSVLKAYSEQIEFSEEN
ncbi:MAG: regulatory protein RecX [Clostridia bacterium]|nr:regulatory protein RecX [Clostridia bacterium]